MSEGEQQGHVPTVRKMLLQGKSWGEIGEAIGWAGDLAREWWYIEGLEAWARTDVTCRFALLPMMQDLVAAWIACGGVAPGRLEITEREPDGYEFLAVTNGYAVSHRVSRLALSLARPGYLAAIADTLMRALEFRGGEVSPELRGSE